MATNPTVAQGFDLVAAAQKEDQAAAMFDAVSELQRDEEYTVAEPTNSLTFLTALARLDSKTDPMLQLSNAAIQESRNLLSTQQERTIRNQIAAKRQTSQLTGLQKLINSLGPHTDPATSQAATAAYNNILYWDRDRKAKIAIEEEAVDRIQDMAASDPVQARVLLNNLEKGNADETVKNFNVRMSVLRQRAEELDQTYQQSGWGRAILNFVLNLVPTNYNFARSGIVGDGSLASWFAVGEGLRDQSERLWSMPMDEFIDYTEKNGPLMQSIASNATTMFDMTSDPKAAVEIMDSLITTTDNQRTWNNIWGGVEVASAVPWGTLSRATRTLVANGAAKQAAVNLENALRVMDEAGPEAMQRATSVSEQEIVEELSVSAIHPRPVDEVPMSEQVAARRESAQQALKEIFDPATGYRFQTEAELQAAFEDTADGLRSTIGSPIKDMRLKSEELSGGAQVHYVEYTFGKKDGHGFASKSAALTAARKSGLAGEPVQLVETPAKIEIETLSPGARYKIYRAVRDFLDSNLPLSEAPEGVSKWLEKTENSFRATKPFLTDIASPLRKFASNKVESKAWDAKEELEEIRNTSIFENAANENTDDWIEELGEDVYLQAERDWSEWFRDLDPFSRKRLTDNPDVAEESWQNYLEQVRDHIGPSYSIRDPSPQVTIAEGASWSDWITLENANDNFVEAFQDASQQWFVRGRKNISETGWYQNQLTPESQGFFGRTFGRWTRSAARTSDPELHGRALEAGTYINRAHKVIQGNMMGVFGKLPKKSQEVVKAVALLGNKRERWFSPEEFNHLVEAQWGRRATDAERDAYLKYQLFNDMDFELRNVAAYVDGVTQGKESVKFRAKWGQEFDVDAKIDYELSQIPRERVYNASKNMHYVHSQNPLTTAQLEALKNEGYVMVRLGEPMTLPEGIKTNLVMIKKTDLEISPLRKEQLAYSQGGHRMYTDGVFVKQGRKGKQPDTGSEYLLAPSTLRTAENIAEGKRWAEVMERARLAMKRNPGLTEQQLDDDFFKHELGMPTGREFLDMLNDEVINLDHPFEAVWDRELPSMYHHGGDDISRLFDENELGLNGYYRTTGRMYTSSKGEILRNTKGEVSDILDPYDTLSKSLEQITRTLGLQNYKTEALERFRTTYGKWLDIQPNHRFPSQVLTEAKVSPTTPIEMRNQIEAQRESILNVLRFETPREKATRQLWQNTASWVIGTGDNAARKFAHDALWWFKERDPLRRLRGLVFDAKLGMFNPGQLLVQISTMFSAMAMSPKYGWQGMSGLFPIHGYLLSKGSENMLETLSKRGTWKIMGFGSEQEFKDYARHLHTHGFADMNGSHIMINDYGPAAHFGSFGSKANGARETGRVFFYTAETWNRLVAYRIAWGEAAEKGLKQSDPNFTATVLRLADDYSMNMTSESAAFWQKGILSIPTQFWAYNVRMMDAMLGKRFTPAQRMRLALAQVGMAGTAGIPGAAAISEYLKEKHGGSPDIDTIEGMMDRGMIDYINYQMTGNDILIGERVGTGGWASETVRALFGASEYGERSFADIAGGATYSIAKKTAEGGISILGSLANYAAAENGSDMGDKAIVGEKLINMFKEISTFSNVTKAMMIHQHGLYKSNKGTVLLSDLPEGNAVYSALSFRPAKAQEISYLIAWEENKKDSIKEIATQLRNWRQEAITNEDKMDENMAKANALIRLVPVGDRAEVIKQTNRITDKSFYDHIEQKVREEKLKEGIVE